MAVLQEQSHGLSELPTCWYRTLTSVLRATGAGATAVADGSSPADMGGMFLNTAVRPYVSHTAALQIQARPQVISARPNSVYACDDASRHCFSLQASNAHRLGRCAGNVVAHIEIAAIESTTETTFHIQVNVLLNMSWCQFLN